MDLLCTADDQVQKKRRLPGQTAVEDGSIECLKISTDQATPLRWQV